MLEELELPLTPKVYEDWLEVVARTFLISAYDKQITVNPIGDRFKSVLVWVVGEDQEGIHVLIKLKADLLVKRMLACTVPQLQHTKLTISLLSAWEDILKLDFLDADFDPNSRVMIIGEFAIVKHMWDKWTFPGIRFPYHHDFLHLYSFNIKCIWMTK